MRYKKKNHLKLLKISLKLKSPRKVRSHEEFLKLLESTPDENFLELQTYSVMIIYHLHWENREYYFEFIEKLLNGPINFLKLRKNHRSINDPVERLQSEFILLEPNPKFKGFDALIDEIVMLFDRHGPEPSLRKNYEFSEEKLKKLIQKIFIKMKDRYI